MREADCDRKPEQQTVRNHDRGIFPDTDLQQRIRRNMILLLILPFLPSISARRRSTPRQLSAEPVRSGLGSGTTIVKIVVKAKTVIVEPTRFPLRKSETEWKYHGSLTVNGRFCGSTGSRIDRGTWRFDQVHRTAEARFSTGYRSRRCRFRITELLSGEVLRGLESL